jgi:hypothetical protein
LKREFPGLLTGIASFTTCTAWRSLLFRLFPDKMAHPDPQQATNIQ